MLRFLVLSHVFALAGAAGTGPSGASRHRLRSGPALEVQGVLRSEYDGLSDATSAPHQLQWIVDTVGNAPHD